MKSRLKEVKNAVEKRKAIRLQLHQAQRELEVCRNRLEQVDEQLQVYKKEETLLQGQKQLTEMIARGDPLELILEDSCKLVELLTQAMRRPWDVIARFVCAMFCAAKAECDGKSRLPSKPRNSTAAKPCCSAKPRILPRFQAGQPRVENEMGRREVFWRPKTVVAIAAPKTCFTKSRRVVFMVS